MGGGVFHGRISLLKLSFPICRLTWTNACRQSQEFRPLTSASSAQGTARETAGRGWGGRRGRAPTSSHSRPAAEVSLFVCGFAPGARSSFPGISSVSGGGEPAAARKGVHCFPSPTRKAWQELSADPFWDSPVSIHSLCKLASAVKLFLKDVSDLMVHCFHYSRHKRVFRQALGEEGKCTGLL